MLSPRRNTPIRTMAHHVSKVYGIARAGKSIFKDHRTKNGDMKMNTIAASAINAITAGDLTFKLNIILT
jgi:hypothetical protein